MSSKSEANLGEQILDVLSHYVSRTNAQSLLVRSLKSAGAAGQEVDERNVATVVQRLQLSAMLFVPNDKREELKGRLAQIQPSKPTAKAAPLPGTETVVVRSENDIVVARTRARIMCEGMASGTVSAHKVATVVSELARNIVSYTPGGTIELTPTQSPPSLSIRAVDRGSGIKNLKEIMDGNYRSKTGLGLGLSGSKRLASQFEVETGPTGTTVLVRMKL